MAKVVIVNAEEVVEEAGDSDWCSLPWGVHSSEADATVGAVGRRHGHGVITRRAALYDALRSRQDGDAEVRGCCHDQGGIGGMGSEALVPVMVKG